MTGSHKPLHTWREALHVYSQPRVLIMLLLGFSAGLPFLLVFSTLSAWLTDANVNRSTIGFFSWIGIMYSVKVFWAPVIDRTPLPILGKLLGQRRSWLLLAQCGIAGGLILLSFSAPENDLQHFALCALLVAFSSATQDVVIDAWRIESASTDYQAAMSASYILGYRVATLAAGAGSLYLADFQSWHLAYQVMSALTLIGIITTLFMREPSHKIKSDTLLLEGKIIHRIEDTIHAQKIWKKITIWFAAAVVSPFAEFFRRSGKSAIIILVLIGSYRITDITMAVMANPFYLDLGFSKTEIASITKLFGFILTIIGAASGGILVMRYGIMRIMLLGLTLVIGSNLMFAWLAQHGPDLAALAMVISADSFAGGIASAVFVAYLSSLTNTAYTATQYALFSSLMTLFPKIIAGFSGVIVEQSGYEMFYIYSSLLSLPALLIIFYMLKNPQPSDN
jgi:PAT family beta-lactamase induction signal transducer AmpG